jgi:hypothetical protein
VTDELGEMRSQQEQQLIQHGWPWPLAKATADDPFDYAIGLRDGTVIRFQGAETSADMGWVTIKGSGLKIIRWGNGGNWLADDRFTFERGLVIRVSEIVWATDAPQGS